MNNQNNRWQLMLNKVHKLIKQSKVIKKKTLIMETQSSPQLWLTQMATKALQIPKK
jgi:hypothetical protein